MKYKYIMAAVAAVMLFATQASAAVKTATMQLSLNNIAVVTVSTSPIIFGDVTTTTAAPVASGTITVNATSGANYKISIDKGLHSVTSGTCRTLASANGQTNRRYQLYSNGSLSARWGDSDTQATCARLTAGSGGVSRQLTGTGSNQTRTVFARALSGTGLGSMSDTVTVTVSY